MDEWIHGCDEHKILVMKHKAEKERQKTEGFLYHTSKITKYMKIVKV